MAERLPQRLVYSVFHLTDLSAESETAFAHALAIALVRGSKLTLLHAGGGADEWDRFPHVRGTLERWGLLEPGSSRNDVFEKLSVQVKKVNLAKSSSVSAVLDYLSSDPSELIVTSYDAHRGITGISRDATAEDLARKSDAMALFVPSKGRGFVSAEDGSLSLRRILVPIAAEPAPAFAIEAARRIAHLLGDPPVEIVLLHVGEGAPTIDARDDAHVRFELRTESGEVIDSIIEVAEEIGADLISMATDGRNSLGETLRGSHTERVARRATCPVLALPESWNDFL